VLAWRLTLGWDWDAGPGERSGAASAQSGAAWLILALGVAAGVGVLAWRGGAVAGTTAVWTPIVVLSGCRLAASGSAMWPIDLASLVFTISAICLIAGGTGAWLRRRTEVRSRPVPDGGDLVGPDELIEPRPLIPQPTARR